MLKSYVKTLAIVAGLGWASAACAVGFGDADVKSALGQPLKIEIALTSVSESDRKGMTAHMASPEAFKLAKLEYPYNLAKLKFDVVVRGRQTYILVTSKEPVNDIAINIVVELNWPAGRLQREFTFLLDPPDYKPDQPKAEEVTPIQPVIPTAQPEAPVAAPIPAAASTPAQTEAASGVEAVPGEATVVATPASMPEATAPGAQEVEVNPASNVQPTSAEQPAAAETQPTAAEAQPLRQPEPVQAKAPAQHETIPVKRGDTLSKIAAQVRPPDMTQEQMLVALYRANVKQFDGRNMNRIRAGKILTIPEAGEYEHLTQKAAVREIRIQTASWRAYRQKLAAAATPATEQPSQQATGTISATVGEKTPPKATAPGGKLVVSPGETPQGKPAPGSKQAKDNAREDAIARELQAQEEKKRLAAQEKINQDLKTAVKVEGGAPQPASPVATTTPPVAASPVQAPSGVRKIQPNVAQPVPVEEKSFLDDILDRPELKDPVYLGGAAGVLIVLVVGGLYLARRRGGEGGGRKKKR